MDRERIERRDFPTGRRGYDPAAVDEHLRRVADEFEAQVHQPPASLSAGASEQVRLILEAAESGASELRARAGEEASDHVARVQVAADGMVSKLDALESELHRLLSALRESGERLTQGLAELQTEVADAAAGPTAPSAPATSSSPPAGDPAGPPASSSPPAGDSAGPPASSSPPAGDSAGPPASSSPPAGDSAGPPASSSPPAGDSAGPPASSSPSAAPGFDAFEEDFAASAPAGEPDEAGARLIALNMALSGSSREETARYLADHFALADPAALLDDVYARAGR